MVKKNNMEAKLIKNHNKWWSLWDMENNCIANTINTDGFPFKLSLKNCQAIERGYDLDELALEEFPYDFDCPLFETLGITEKAQKSILIGMLQGTLIKGFQTAMEILGDKKFSEEDISKAIDFGVHVEAGNIDIDYKKYGTHQNQFIQSQQQTEWEVEIVTKNSRTGKIIKSELDLTWDEDGLCDIAIPKLDEKGKLILKRK